MEKIFIQPARDLASARHIRKTLDRPIDLSVLSSLSPANLEKTYKAFGTSPFRLWSPKPSEKNEIAWKQMSKGDSVLIYAHGSDILRHFKVKGTMELPELGELVWDPVDSSGTPFRHLYALGEEEKCEMSLSDFKQVLGYKDNYTIQGFRGLNDQQSLKLLAALNSSLGPPDIFDEIAEHESDFAEAPETEKEELRKSRIGQGLFRKKLLGLWSGSCAVSGIQNEKLLRASHIKPWKDSDNKERLDPYNGLPLLPHYDHLFDAGFISFENNGEIILSDALQKQERDAIGVHSGLALEHIYLQHRPYLAYHRENVLIGNKL